MSKRNPDWSKTGTIAGYAEYLRKQGGALCVIVLRVDDSVLAPDPELPLRDLPGLVEQYLPGLIADLAAAREEKRKAARNQLPPVRE